MRVQEEVHEHRLGRGSVVAEQAMDVLAAAGVTSIDTPQSNADGSWTSYAYDNRQGRRVRFKVDPRGHIFTAQ